MTVLDDAHAVMNAAPEDEAARRRFYARFAASEMFLILEEEPAGDAIAPLILQTEDGSVALVFDAQDRLAAFVDGPTPFIAISGRRLAELLQGAGVMLGLNLGVAPSSMLLPPDALDWLREMGTGEVVEEQSHIASIDAPTGLPEDVLAMLDERLAQLAGIAQAAYLISATYASGAKGHALAIPGVPTAAQAQIAEAMVEALGLSGAEAATLDVIFPEPDSALLSKLEAVALRFDIPEIAQPARATPQAPGSDPDRPPLLR